MNEEFNNIVETISVAIDAASDPLVLANLSKALTYVEAALKADVDAALEDALASDDEISGD